MATVKEGGALEAPIRSALPYIHTRVGRGSGGWFDASIAFLLPARLGGALHADGIARFIHSFAGVWLFSHPAYIAQRLSAKPVSSAGMRICTMPSISSDLIRISMSIVRGPARDPLAAERALTRGWR